MSEHNPDMPVREVALARAENALGELGLDPSDENLAEQLGVFVAALGVMSDREAVYGGAWKRHGLRDKTDHLRNKLARLQSGIALLDTLPPAPSPEEKEREAIVREALRDSALDMINYAGFLVRQIEKGADVE